MLGATCDALHTAHETLIVSGLMCTLDRRARIVVPDERLRLATRTVEGVFAAHFA